MAMNIEELVDYIGVESSIDIRPDALDNQAPRRRRRSEEENEYPLPMLWLAHTKNLPSHMPWVMHKYHTSDGRIVITKDKVNCHEYFEAFRSNGRLVLNLIHLNDGGDDEAAEDLEEEINGPYDEKGGGVDAPGLEPLVHT